MMGGEQSQEKKAEEREEEPEKPQEPVSAESSDSAASEGTRSYSDDEVTEYFYSFVRYFTSTLRLLAAF